MNKKCDGSNSGCTKMVVCRAFIAYSNPEMCHSFAAQRDSYLPASKTASSGAQLKCLCARTCSIGNKQEELEMCICLQGYDLIDITETWWDVSYGWNVGMERYRLFRKVRQRRWGGDVAFYVNDQLEGMELCLGIDEELTYGPGLERVGTGVITIRVC